METKVQTSCFHGSGSSCSGANKQHLLLFGLPSSRVKAPELQRRFVTAHGCGTGSREGQSPGGQHTGQCNPGCHLLDPWPLLQLLEMNTRGELPNFLISPGLSLTLTLEKPPWLLAPILLPAALSAARPLHVQRTIIWLCSHPCLKFRSGSCPRKGHFPPKTRGAKCSCLPDTPTSPAKCKR